MLTDADHVWHAMYFKHPNERARYIRSQIPHADADHLLRKYNKFPKIYRDDLVEFAVIVNGKVIDTVQKRQDAHDLAKQQEGYVIVADVPKSESRHPQYDRYYQEIIKTPLVPSEEETTKNGNEQEVEQSTVDETAVDETTVDETTVDETTVDETTVDETAVDETTVAKQTIEQEVEQTTVAEQTLEQEVEPSADETTFAETSTTEEKEVEPSADETTFAETSTTEEKEVEQPSVDEPVINEPENHL